MKRMHPNGPGPNVGADNMKMLGRTVKKLFSY